MAPSGINSGWYSGYKCHCSFQRFQLLGQVVTTDEKNHQRTYSSDTEVIWRRRLYIESSLQYWWNRHLPMPWMTYTSWQENLSQNLRLLKIVKLRCSCQCWTENGEPHLSTSSVTTFCLISDQPSSTTSQYLLPPLHSTSQVALFPAHFQSKIYCSIYAFPNHQACMQHCHCIY